MKMMKLNIQLFAGGSASKTIYSNGSSTYGYTIAVSWTEASSSVETNKSKITGYASLYGKDINFNVTTGGVLYFDWYDNKSKTWTNKGSKSINSTTRGTTYKAEVSFEVEHNSDGKLSGLARVRWDKTATTGTYVPNDGEIATDEVALTNIPRASSVSATSCDVESATTIKIDRKSSSFTHNIKLVFGNKTAYVDSNNGLSGSSSTRLSGTEYKPKIPTSWYEVIKNKPPYANCTVTCTTYSGSNAVGSATTTTFRITANKEKTKPIISGMVVTADNDKIYNVELDDETFIQHLSLIRIEEGIYPRHYATLTKTTITNGSQTVDGYFANGELAITLPQPVTSRNIEFYALDSRGYDNTGSYEIPDANYIPYEFPSITANFVRNQPTDGKANLILSGSYYAGQLGGSANSLSIQYVYREKGQENWSSPINITYTSANGKIEQQTIELTPIFDYKKSYEFQLTYADTFSQNTINDSISVGLPTYWWNREKFVVNGELKVANNNGENEKSIVDLIYPVGSIYISVNSTNPETLFGGKWEQIKDTFLLGAGDTYSAGTTGGEATHTLTVDEMPSHTHGMVYGYGGGSDNTYNALVTGKTLSNTYAKTEIMNEGGGKAHNNMPPYLSVYVWKRVS